MRKLILFVASLSLAGPAAAAAQSLDDVGTYAALTRTPAGGLPPMLTHMLIDRMQNGVTLGLRYGHLQEGDFNSTTHLGGVTAILPLGLSSSLSLTGGAVFSDETTVLGGTESVARLMLGVGGDARLVGATMGAGPTATLWTVSVTGEFGYSARNPGSFISGYLGLPVALVPRGTGMQFVPFITPGLGFGQSSTSGSSAGGAAFMLGGGLGVYNSDSNVMLNFGAQHVFKDGSQTMIGLNLLLGGR